MIFSSTKFALIGLLCYVSLIQCQEEPTLDDRQITNALNSALHIMEVTAKAIENKDPSQFIRAIASLISHFAGDLKLFAGTISTIFYLFDGEPNIPHLIVTKKLKDVNNMLDSIHEQPNSIPEEMKDDHLLYVFRNRRDEVLLLQPLFGEYSEDPSDIKRREFLAGCDRYSMVDVINWLDDEFTRTGPMSLISVLTRDRYRAKLTAGSKLIVATFISASILREACFGVQYYDYERSKYDLTLIVETNQITRQLEKIVTAIWREDSVLEVNFMQYAMNDVENLARDRSDLDHKDFASTAYSLLVQKYDWTHWFLASYSGSTEGWGEHTISIQSSNAFYWFRNFGRSVIVASTKKWPQMSEISFSHHVNHCLKVGIIDVLSVGSCQQLYAHLDKCLTDKKVAYGLLACVRHGNGFRATHYSGDGIVFKNVALVFSRIVTEDWVPWEWDSLWVWDVFGSSANKYSIIAVDV